MAWTDRRHARPADRRPAAGAAIAGVVLLLAGIVLLALWRVVAGTQAQPWSPGARPPATVHVTAGSSYQLAVPGGVSALLAHGVVTRPGRGGTDLPALACDWSSGRAEPQPLSLAAESVATNATDTVATFDAPRTGAIRVTCTGWGAMFVPDADGAPGDRAGLFLLLSVVTLSVGAMLAMSALHAACSTARLRTFAAARPARGSTTTGGGGAAG